MYTKFQKKMYKISLIIIPSERNVMGKYTYAAQAMLIKELIPPPDPTNINKPCHHSYRPHIYKLFHAPHKSETPPHIEAVLKGCEQAEWMECLYNAYDKIHTTGTLSIPFLLELIPEDNNVLRPRVTCEVRIIDTDNYYGLKC